MSLLIKKGIFEEELARFYIAELTCAIDSVHKMGFIHRYLVIIIEHPTCKINFVYSTEILNQTIY